MTSGRGASVQRAGSARHLEIRSRLGYLPQARLHRGGAASCTPGRPPEVCTTVGKGPMSAFHPLRTSGVGVPYPQADERSRLGPRMKQKGRLSAAFLFDSPKSVYPRSSCSSFFAISSIFSGGQPGISIPSRRPMEASTSLISFSDFRPKFLVLSISCSLRCTSSPT